MSPCAVQQQVGAGAEPVLVRVCTALGSAMLKTHHFCPFFSSKTWCDPGGMVWTGEETCCIPHSAAMKPRGRDCSESLREIFWQEKSGFCCVPPPQPVASMASEAAAGGAVRHRQRGGREGAACRPRSVSDVAFATSSLSHAKQILSCSPETKFGLIALVMAA